MTMVVAWPLLIEGAVDTQAPKSLLRTVLTAGLLLRMTTCLVSRQ